MDKRVMEKSKGGQDEGPSRVSGARPSLSSPHILPLRDDVSPVPVPSTSTSVAAAAALFSCEKPLQSAQPWALRSRMQSALRGGETAHRNNLLSLARRCIQEGDWGNAALVAAQLLVAVRSYRAREQTNEAKHKDRNRREAKRLKASKQHSELSQHSEEHLLDVWKVVTEVAMHFPGQVPATSLERFSRKVYSMIPSTRQHKKHKKEITAEIVNAELVTDLGRALTEINGLREADSKHERLEPLLTMGLIQYQRWFDQLRKEEERDRDRDRDREWGGDGEGGGHVKVNFYEELEKSLTSSEYHWYKPNRWSMVTEERYSDAMEKLMSVFHPRIPLNLSFKMECLVMSRLFHLHAAKKNLERFFQHMKEYREKQILRFRESSTAYLERLDLLLCLLVERLPQDYDDPEVVDPILHYTSALANSEPSSTAPLETLLSVIHHIQKRNESLRETDLNGKSDTFSLLRMEVFKHLLAASFLHLDVCAASEMGWQCLARALEEMEPQDGIHTEDRQEMQRENERRDFVSELWKPRRDWWRKLHFNGRIFLSDLLSTEGQHPLLKLKLVCCKYLDPENKAMLSHASRLPGDSLLEEEEEEEEDFGTTPTPTPAGQTSVTVTDDERDEETLEAEGRVQVQVQVQNADRLGIKSFSLLSEALEALESLKQAEGQGEQEQAQEEEEEQEEPTLGGSGMHSKKKKGKNKELEGGLKIHRSKKICFHIEFQ